MQASEYTIDTSAFDGNKDGEYEIKVAYRSQSAAFTVKVVKQAGGCGSSVVFAGGAGIAIAATALHPRGRQFCAKKKIRISGKAAAPTNRGARLPRGVNNEKGKAERITLWIVFVLFFFYAISLVLPLIWTFINSFKTNRIFSMISGDCIKVSDGKLRERL